METKVCTKCKQEKPLTEFTRESTARDIRRSACKSCTREHRKEARMAGTAQTGNDLKLNKRARELGVTREELERLMVSQCSVCGGGPGAKRSTVVGEDRPRGVLCSRCVLFAGRVTDPEAIRKLAALLDGESVL